MSTNFEIYDQVRREVRHLGQRAGGWQFLFRAYPDLGILETQAWLRQLDHAGWVKDEYGREYSSDEFLEAVEACRDGRPRPLGLHEWRDQDGNAFCSTEFS